MIWLYNPTDFTVTQTPQRRGSNAPLAVHATAVAWVAVFLPWTSMDAENEVIIT
jgi:hypothetical protein